MSESAGTITVTVPSGSVPGRPTDRGWVEFAADGTATRAMVTMVRWHREVTAAVTCDAQGILQWQLTAWDGRDIPERLELASERAALALIERAGVQLADAARLMTGRKA